YFITRPPPTSTLFPYTTLFRSRKRRRTKFRAATKPPPNAAPPTNNPSPMIIVSPCRVPYASCRGTVSGANLRSSTQRGRRVGNGKGKGRGRTTAQLATVSYTSESEE